MKFIPSERQIMTWYSINFNNILHDHIHDVDRMVDQFYGILRETFENFIPKSKIKSSNKRTWHDKDH